MGLCGFGNGFDDDVFEFVWVVFEYVGFVVFFYLYYGVDGKEWGGRDNGYVFLFVFGFLFEIIIVSVLFCVLCVCCFKMLLL